LKVEFSSDPEIIESIAADVRSEHPLSRNASSGRAASEHSHRLNDMVAAKLASCDNWYRFKFLEELPANERTHINGHGKDSPAAVSKRAILDKQGGAHAG
jgi:hypothetical protein